MGFSEKYKNGLKQQEIIDSCPDTSSADIQLQLDECRSQLEQHESASKMRVWGIVLLLASLVLLVLEILCLTETLIVGYSDFAIIDLVIIGLPFFIGLRLLRKKSELGSKEDLEKQEKQLQELLEEAKKSEAEFEAAQEAVSYDGYEWDFRAFRPTPANVADMERDFEDLMIAIKCTKDADLMINCWFTLKELQHMNAIFANDQAAKDAFDAASERIRQTESWTLQLALVAMSSLSLALLQVYLGGSGDSPTATVKELWAKGSKPPRNADEQALLDVTDEVVEDIKREVTRQIRAQMGK